MNTFRSQFVAVLSRINKCAFVPVVFSFCTVIATMGLIAISPQAVHWKEAASNLELQTRRGQRLVEPYQALYQATRRTSDPEVLHTNLRRLYDGLRADGYYLTFEDTQWYPGLLARLEELPAVRPISEQKFREKWLGIYEDLRFISAPNTLSFGPERRAQNFFDLFWVFFWPTLLTGTVAIIVYLYQWTCTLQDQREAT